MCAPGCIEHVAAAVSRRTLLKGTAGAIAAAAALAPSQAEAFPAFRRIIDLTHTHSPEFPTFSGEPGIAMKQVMTRQKDGYNLMEWTLNEHSGTHMDAPIHFSESGPGPAEIVVDRLVVPLAVINVVDKAGADPDYQLSPRDIRIWERQNGRLPAGCCVAMDAGWDHHVGSSKFLGKDASGGLHFPGFHPEAADMLLRERRVFGIAVDTLSLDHGASKDFKTHNLWLPAGRWGLENVANLGRLPARGAVLVVGAPKIKGATGGPVRLLALI
jgi:kynurenine formamidase